MENKTFCGEQVSEYGIKSGYVDYRTLAKRVGDMILCNNMEQRLFNTLELQSGNDRIFYDSEGNEVDSDSDDIANEEYHEVYQWYIISDNGAKFLENYTDEIVFYDNELDIYVWGITHFGTSWDYVLTDIKVG